MDEGALPTLRVDAGRPWLDRIFFMRHALDRALDGLFDGVALPAGCELLLFNEADAGFGDIAFATRLLGLLLAHAPGLRPTLVSSSPEKQRLFGLPDGVTLRGFSELDGAQEPALPPSLVVSAPGIFDHCRSPGAVLSRLRLPAATPFLYLAEYGSIRQLRADALGPLRDAIRARVEDCLDRAAAREGVPPGDMGHRGRGGEVLAVTPQGMRQVDHLGRAFTELGADNPLRPFLTAPVSSARSCGLDEGELGVHVDAALVTAAGRSAGADGREAAIEGLRDPVARAFLRGGGALYVGYAYSGLGMFCDLVAAAEAGRGAEGAGRPEGSLDVVVPNARPAAEILARAFDAPLLSRLRGAGIGKIVVAGNAGRPPDGAAPEGNDEDAWGGRGAAPLGAVGDGGADTGAGPAGALAVHALELGEGRTLRLLTRHPIPNADHRALLLASAPLTMVSGDQSFSDAISAGKAIALMEPVYCQTFHIDSFLALAEEADAGLGATLRLGMQARLDEMAWAGSLEGARSGALARAGRRLSARIRAGHDASAPLVRAITRRLWTEASEEVSEASRALLARAWPRYRPEGTLELPAGALDALRRIVDRLPRAPGRRTATGRPRARGAGRR